MKRYTDEQKIQVITLRAEGLTLREIAEKSSINNLTTVHNLCVAAGFDKKPYPVKFIYAVGQRHHSFIILEQLPSKQLKCGTMSLWKCQCDCGDKFAITSKQIHRGQTSCGCLSRTGTLNKGRFVKSKSSKDAVSNYKFVNYQISATKRNICWNLSKEQFIELLFGDCFYCNSPPLTLVKVPGHELMTNGVDRVHNETGYFSDNCVSCCKFCNRGKGNASLEEFTNYILRIKNETSQLIKTKIITNI